MEKMDLDIGNIFYIIITLVAVILGLAGRKRKKPSVPQSGSSESGKTPGFMENLENILKMGQEEPVVSGWQEEETDYPPQTEEHGNEIPPEEREPVYVSAEPSFQQEYQNILKKDQGPDANRILEVREEDMQKLEVIDLDVEEGVSYFDIVRDFDAGTAVVYAAIINRIDY